MKKNSPLITIITVVLNDPCGLEITLRSILEQDHPNTQLLLIDGGSGAATQAVLQKYSVHFDYCVSEPDQGIYDAMNKGIKEAKGDWLHFLNAGDRYHTPTALSNLAENADTRYSLLYTDVYYEAEDGRQFLSTQKPLFRHGIFTSINHQGTYYNVAKLGDLLQFDTQYANSADAALLLDIYFFDENYPTKKIKNTAVIYKMGGFSTKTFENLFPERRDQFDSKIKNPWLRFLNHQNLLRQERKHHRSLLRKLPKEPTAQHAKILVFLLNKRCDCYGLFVLSEMAAENYTLFLSKYYEETVDLPHSRVRTYTTKLGFLLSGMFNLPLLLAKIIYLKLTKNYRAAYFPFFHHWSLPILILCRLLRIKTIFTVHDGILHLGEQNTRDQGWQNACINRADELIFLTEYVRRQAQRSLSFKGGATVIPHGINLPKGMSFVDRKHSTQPKILFLGRILPYKGVDLLLAAVQQLPDTQYTHLTIAGEVRYPLVIPKSDKITLRDQFVSEGEFITLLNEHDILVLPYREATQSGIISFGIATAIPMICTNVGGLAEQITPHTEALFVAPTPTAIHAALLQLIEKKETYDQLHRNLKRKRKNDGWAMAARKIEALAED